METSEKRLARGSRFRTAYLLAQARYIAGLARSDPVVSDVAGVQLLARLDAETKLVEELQIAWDRARFDALKFTMDERATARVASAWIAHFREFCRVAVWSGSPLPALPPGPPSTSRSPVPLAVEIATLVEVGRQHADVLGPVGITRDYLARGESLGAALAAADERQEVMRGAHLRDHVRRLNAQKARLYALVKQVITTGRSVHVDEPSKGRQYNVGILHRGPGEERSRDPAASAAG